MPNVTGTLHNNQKGFLTNATGAFYPNTWKGTFGKEWTSYCDANFNLSRVSNQYQSINEVRVKSIISIGFIKLY